MFIIVNFYVPQHWLCVCFTFAGVQEIDEIVTAVTALVKFPHYWFKTSWVCKTFSPSYIDISCSKLLTLKQGVDIYFCEASVNSHNVSESAFNNDTVLTILQG